jgi:hypothetical protein
MILDLHRQARSPDFCSVAECSPQHRKPYIPPVAPIASADPVRNDPVVVRSIQTAPKQRPDRAAMQNRLSPRVCPLAQ